MWDLFSGLGGASQAMKDRGWRVIRIDSEERFKPDIVCDLGEAIPDAQYLPKPDLIWASPPCTEFSREFMPWCRTGESPSCGLVWATYRHVWLHEPRWWVLENVVGAQRWLGRAPRHIGPFYLWGYYPPFKASVRPFKEKLSSSQDAERAKIPYALSLALAEASERAATFAVTEAG